GLDVADDLFARAALGYRLGDANKPPEERPLELVLSLSLASRISDFLGKFNTEHAEAIAGGSYQINPRWNLLLGAGLGLEAGYGTPDWRVLTSLRHTFRRGPAPPPPPPVVSCAEAPPVYDRDCDGRPTAPTPETPASARPEGEPPPVFPIPEHVWEEKYDYCPEQPGTELHHGCPEPAVAINECSGVDVSPSVLFDPEGEITRPSRVPLKELARQLSQRDQSASQAVNIEVTGPDKTEATARGELVKMFLTGKGASADNLTVMASQRVGADGYEVAFTIVCPEVAISTCPAKQYSAPISVSPTIAFDGESDQVTARSVIPLDRLADEMTGSAYADTRFKISVTGPDKQLAERRASKLVDYMKGKGVQDIRVADIGMGMRDGGASDGYSVVFTRHCKPDEPGPAVCENKTLSLDRKIEFDVNSDVIKPNSIGVLKADAAWLLQDYADMSITIEGHTSGEGRRDYNMKLSQRRADSVRNFLISQGIAGSQLKAVGYGPTNLLVAETGTGADLQAQREKNRRIEFRVTRKPKGCPCADQIKVDKIQFEFNSPQIKSESFPSLQEVARTLKARQDVHLRIEGHTSSEGSRRANQRLSQRRAKAILDFLIGEGVARNRLQSRGFGESRLLVKPDDNEEKREINRRVEFVITKSDETCQE
ncbi:MAG: OmpA family protein, partial [Myxococcota bacterium]